jgi:type II secretory pathway component PulF
VIFVGIAFPFVAVLPRIIDMFHQMGADLPPTTELCVNVAYAIQHHWPAILVIVVVAGATLFAFVASGAARAPGGLALNLLFVGRDTRNAIAAAFSRCVGTLLEHGVSPADALALAQSAARSIHAQQFIGDVRDGLSDGESLGAMLARHPFFDAAACETIRDAEQRGKVDRALLDLASAIEERERNRTRRIAWRIIVIEILFGLLLWAFVWWVLVYLPYAHFDKLSR